MGVLSDIAYYMEGESLTKGMGVELCNFYRVFVCDSVYSQVGTPSARFGGWGIGGVLGITPFLLGFY
jgi:hypothetical protein